MPRVGVVVLVAIVEVVVLEVVLALVMMEVVRAAPLVPTHTASCVVVVVVVAVCTGEGAVVHQRRQAC